MIRRVRILMLALILLGPSTALLADDLTGADDILCSPGQVTACYANGVCETTPPWELNIPDFIQIDLSEKILHTTRASGQNRSTPIKHIERADGLLVIQGFEEGRAFSLLVNETTGRVSTAVAREGINVAIFGVCTPVPSR